MVKVVDGKAEEEKKKERLEKLVKLASQLFGKEQIMKPLPPLPTFYVKGKLTIYPNIREIESSNKEDYDSTLNLAEKYEEIDTDEWKVTTFY